MKQSKLRRRRVIRYAVLYFVLLVVFLGLIVGPVVLKKIITDTALAGYYRTAIISKMPLMQPNFLSMQNTNASVETGTGALDYTYPSGYGPSSSSGSTAAAT